MTSIRVDTVGFVDPMPGQMTVDDCIEVAMTGSDGWIALTDEERQLLAALLDAEPRDATVYAPRHVRASVQAKVGSFDPHKAGAVRVEPR